jgi:hypothetical protein
VPSLSSFGGFGDGTLLPKWNPQSIPISISYTVWDSGLALSTFCYDLVNGSHDVFLFLKMFYYLHLYFFEHLLGKSLLIIAGLLTGFVSFSLNLFLSLLMIRSPLSNSLRSVVITCRDET